jgi:hypothetical protein
MAVAVAVVCGGAEMTTCGGLVYPLPGDTGLICVTTPLATSAIAVAPVPPPPSTVTIGGSMYPDPPSVTV